MWPWRRLPDDPTTTSTYRKDLKMNRTSFSAIALAFAALSAGQAMAASPIVNGEIYPADAVAQASTVTRAKVKAELAEVARTGVLAQNGEIPAQAAVQTAGKSRAEVQAELAAAQRSGTVLNYSGA